MGMERSSASFSFPLSLGCFLTGPNTQVGRCFAFIESPLSKNKPAVQAQAGSSCKRKTRKRETQRKKGIDRGRHTFLVS